jgi:hypothetical protein
MYLHAVIPGIPMPFSIPSSKKSILYIDDVLSINNDQFHSHVDSIYPNKLEIKDTTKSSTSASYLDKIEH